jgi:hypothetical protein
MAERTAGKLAAEATAKPCAASENTRMREPKAHGSLFLITIENTPVREQEWI